MYTFRDLLGFDGSRTRDDCWCDSRWSSILVKYKLQIELRQYVMPPGYELTKHKVWNANIAAGTRFVMSAFDGGTLRQGGSSNLLTVQSGNAGSSCLDDSSPSSTVANTATATHTGGASKTTGDTVKTVTAIASGPASRWVIYRRRD